MGTLDSIHTIAIRRRARMFIQPACSNLKVRHFLYNILPSAQIWFRYHILLVSGHIVNMLALCFGTCVCTLCVQFVSAYCLKQLAPLWSQFLLYVCA